MLDLAGRQAVRTHQVQATGVEQITSRRNPIVSQFRKIARAAAPLGSTVLLEGPRLVGEAIAAAVRIDIAAISSSLGAIHRTAAVIDKFDPEVTRLVRVSPEVMEALSPASRPSGLVALASLRAASFEALTHSPCPLVVGLLDVQDPGNTGAIIRAVEAGGATGVITVGGADPYGWKALRGSMGSSFRLPVIRSLNLDEVRAEANSHGLRMLATVPHHGTPVSDTDLRVPCIIWFGSEGNGLDTRLVNLADKVVSIPMRPPVESLNVAVAAALIVYAATGQRSG